MKAAVYRAYGPPQVLRIQDVPTPTPHDDEVLVQVLASSVNDYDWHLLTGRPFLNRVGGFTKPRHLILGSDIAGRVEAVGARVTGYRPGDVVFADLSPHGFGAFAEYVTAPERALAPLPAGLSVEQAAAVPQAGSLAVMGLRGRRPIQPGDAVLVNGAGGGTGTFAVQIATALGAEVTGVDAGHKLDGIRALGADHVIDYAVEDFAASGQTYDLILDVAAHRSIATYRRCLRPGGVCAITGGALPRVFWIMAAGPVSSLVANRKVSVPLWRPNHPQDVAFLTGLLETGSVTPLIDSVVPLDDIAEAFRRFGAQEHTGKIVITI